MKNKGIAPVVIVAVVVVVAAAAAGGYFMLSGGGGGAGGGPSEGIVWSDVSSLDMGIKLENEGEVIAEGSMKVKGIGTSQTKFRRELTYSDFGETVKYIVNEETEKAWIYWGYVKGWSSLENNPMVSYEEIQTDTENMLSDVENNFSGWSEGENITIQIEEGTTIRFYNIDVNTEIDDSLFEDPIENQQGGGETGSFIENQLENIENQLG